MAWGLRIALAVAAALIPAAAANATTYCVGSYPGCSGTSEPTVQAALTASEGTAGNDSVYIGDGTYTGPFTWDPSGVSGTLAIIGHSQTATHLSAGSATVLKLGSDSNSAVASVSGIGITIPAGAATGLSTSGNVSGVTVTRTSMTVCATGISAAGDAAVQSVTVDMGAENECGNSGVTLYQQATLSNSTVAAGYAVEATGGQHTIRRTTVTADYTGVESCGNNVSEVDNVLVRLRGDNAIAFDTYTNRCGGSTSVSTQTISHATVIGTGAEEQTLAHVSAPSNGSNAATATLTSVVSDGVPVTAYRQSADGNSAFQSQITFRNSLVDLTHQQAQGPGQIVDGGGNLTGAPLFADAANGDFRPLWNSPLVDHGSTAPLDASSESTFDLLGRSRIADGDGDGVPRRDIGAYEYHGPVPRLAGPASATVGAVLGYDASASSDPDTDTLSFTWSFDDGAAAVGPQVQHAWATPGAHKVSLTVVDTTGLIARTSLTTVVATPGSGGGGPGGGGSKDTTAPAIGALKLSPARFLVARGSTPTSAKLRKGTTIRFTLSEAASVKLTITAKGRRSGRKCVAKRRRGKACTLTLGTLTRTRVPAGSVKLAFTGRIGRKALRPGRYTLTAVATDAAGNRSSARKATFTIATA
jgi:PKD domain